MSTEHPDLARLAAARPSRVAEVIAAVTDPAIVVAAVTAFVAAHGADDLLAGLGWAALAIGFCVVVPYVVLFGLLAGGIVADRHVVRREQRLWPALAALVSEVVGLGLLGWWGAPRILLVLMVAQLCGLVVISVVTLVSKASLHTATTTGALGVVAVQDGGPWWAIAPMAAVLVGWARWRGGRHSLRQVLTGAAIGAATIAAVYWTLSAGPLVDLPVPGRR